MSDKRNIKVILDQNHPLYGSKGEVFSGDDAAVFPKQHCHMFTQLSSPMIIANPHIRVIGRNASKNLYDSILNSGIASSVTSNPPPLGFTVEDWDQVMENDDDLTIFDPEEEDYE